MKSIKSTFILSLLLSSVCLTNCRKESIEEEEVIKVEEVFLESICGESLNPYYKYKFLKKNENIDATIISISPENVPQIKYYYISTLYEGKIIYLTPCNLSEEYKVNNLKVKITFNQYSMTCRSQPCPSGYFPSSEILSIEKQ